MAKHQKNDYFDLLFKMAENAVANTTAFLSAVRTQKTVGTPKQNGRILLNFMRENLSKDYFTRLEREDFLMLAILLGRLCDESLLLLSVFPDNMIMNDIKAAAECLDNSVLNIRNTMLAMQGFPKNFSITPFIKKHDETTLTFHNIRQLSIQHHQNGLMNQIDDCFSCGCQVMHYAEYAVMKNT